MVAARGIARPPVALTKANASGLPGQLGVFEIIDEAGATLLIGQAGGHEPFGLRSAIASLVERYPGAQVRHECTHAYRSRWQELLMLHQAVHGQLPVDNATDARMIGRLS